MNYFDEIKNELVNNEINRKVKNYSINKNDLNAYYNVGKMLSEAGKHYGEGIIKEYSKRLTEDLGKGYSKRNLWLMLRFYQLKEKMQTLSAQLSWSHYCELLSFENIDKINYYIELARSSNLSVRQLRQRIRSNEYERLDEKTRNKLINKERNAFCFIGSEYKIKIGNSFNYIDLLLYNYEYNCFVVVELKVTELRKDHIGQIGVYMNYIDQNIKKISQDKTIGIII